MKVINNFDFLRAVSELLPKLLGEALRIVIIVTILGFILALIVGFILALARVSKSKILNGIVIVFQEIIRGTPLLVQLVYIYYVVPLLIEVIVYLITGNDQKVEMSPVVAGIIGMGINYGTYISEVIRSAIISIDKGQIEAGLALGLSRRQAMFRIVIPQAIRNSIPVFGNYLVMLVKDTSLMAYITAQEFLMTTKAYTAQTFLTIESYTILALVYLCICIPLSLVMKLVERKLNKNLK
ncbi:MAG: amino acid ABC transporter permease [Clostridiales bacterium]|nr:amino acid ABC transporter permease [Clostridiales bacterium]